MNSEKQETGIIYCRVSSKDQVDGTSLGSQERLSGECAERENIKILKIYIEKGESAKTADRTELNRALTFCANNKNKVDFFIVYKIDRFARNQDDHITIRALLKKSGTSLRSATEPISDDSMGRTMEGMLSVFAELDNNIRTERTKQGMLENLKKGIWQWEAPLGYYRPYKGSNIVPEPNTAPHISVAFNEYSKGIYTYKSLAKFLEKKGFQTRTKKLPTPQLIEKLIKNPLYCGIIRTWGEFEGSFESIISKGLFYKCQSIVSGSSHANSRSANNPMFPLRKATMCSNCNVSLTGSSSTGRKGKKYPYYHHVSKGCSKSKSIPKESFEQNFVEFLEDITPNPKYEKLFKAIVLDIWKNNYKKIDKENAKIRKDIERLENERQTVFDLHRKGIYSEEDFKDQKKLINKRINQKHSLIKESRVEELNMEEALEYCFNFIRNTSKAWIEANYQTKLRLQNLIFKDKIEFDGKKFGTASLSSIYAINKEDITGESKLVAPRGDLTSLHSQ